MLVSNLVALWQVVGAGATGVFLRLRARQLVAPISTYWTGPGWATKEAHIWRQWAANETSTRAAQWKLTCWCRPSRGTRLNGHAASAAGIRWARVRPRRQQYQQHECLHLWRCKWCSCFSSERRDAKLAQTTTTLGFPPQSPPRFESADSVANLSLKNNVDSNILNAQCNELI